MYRKKFWQLFTLISTSIVFLNSSALAISCNVTSDMNDAGLPPLGTIWYPSTYIENAVLVVPIYDHIENVWETITVDGHTNCYTQQVTWNKTFTYSVTETMIHTANGSEEDTIGLEVGNDNIAKVGLQHATLQENGSQYVDSWEEIQSKSVSIPVAPCSGVTYTLRGKRRDGTQTGKFSIKYSVNYTVLGSTEVHTFYGECKVSESMAASSKKYISIEDRVDPRTPRCGVDSPCAECTGAGE